MRRTLLRAIVLASACITASGALDAAANDYAERLEKSAPRATPEQRACMVRTARDTAFVDTDDQGVAVRLRPSAHCLHPDAGTEGLGGSVQYRVNGLGHIIGRRVLQ